MKLRLLVLATLAFAAGCTHATRYLGPNGEQMVEVHCNGAMLDFGDCQNRARQECGGNYTVAGQSAQTNYVANMSATGAGVTPVATRDLVVQCTSTPQ